MYSSIVISVCFTNTALNCSGCYAILAQGAYVSMDPRLLPPPLDITTRGHGSSQISWRPFCYWNLMIHRPRGALLHKYLHDKSLHRSTCLLSPPLVLTTFPHTLSFYYADSYTDLPVTLWFVLTVSGPTILRQWFPCSFATSASFLPSTVDCPTIEIKFFYQDLR